MDKATPEWYGEMSKTQKRLVQASGPIVFSAAVLTLARVAVFNPTCVPSASMEPTLQVREGEPLVC